MLATAIGESWESWLVLECWEKPGDSVVLVKTKMHFSKA